MVLWAVATLVAFYVKGLCGFANTLVFTSILGFGVNNVEISPVELILGYPSNIILTWKHRNELDKKVYLPLAVLVILGSIPGAFLLKKRRCKIHQAGIWFTGNFARYRNVSEGSWQN